MSGPRADGGPDAERDALARLYQRHYNPALAKLFQVARVPIEDHGRGSWLFAEDGRGYLDFSAGYGVFGVGHLNPAVQRAAQDQLAAAASLPIGVTHPIVKDLERRLRDLLPDGLDQVLLAGSGSEAMEIALRVVAAAAPRGCTRLVAVNDSYHGKSLGALTVMGQRQLRSKFEPLWPDVSFVPFGDPAAVAERAERWAPSPRSSSSRSWAVAIFVVPPAGYLAEVARLCRDAGVLLVIDEVQTGFGRTGSMFAIEAEGVVPDLIVVSKGMTGGHVPMAAVVVHDDVALGMPAEAWLSATRPAAEITASLVACAAANAAIDVTARTRATRARGSPGRTSCWAACAMPASGTHGGCAVFVVEG